MDKLILRKGNLFNQLENKIDYNLLDSSQYDLEIKTGTDKKQYRIRYINSEYFAKKIMEEQLITGKYSKHGTSVLEVSNVRKTNLFRENFPYWRQFQKEYYKNEKKVPDYYAFLQRVTQKNNLNNNQELYNFTLPAIHQSKKEGVDSYDIQIEQVKNRFVIIFFKENVQKGYLQKEEPQYIIYERQDFIKKKTMLTDQVLNLAIERGYPLNLLEYIYVISGGDIEFISHVFEIIERVGSYNQFCTSPLFHLLKLGISKDEELQRELIRFFNKEQEDINYTFNNKKLMIKRNP